MAQESTRGFRADCPMMRVSCQLKETHSCLRSLGVFLCCASKHLVFCDVLNVADVNSVDFNMSLCLNYLAG